MQYRFLDCELDERSRMLRRGGAEVSLEPKGFDLLTSLIENRDRVVSRRELFERLWPSQFVGDAALSRCVWLARRAIGDSGRSARAIQTFHRHGYRFIAAVRAVAAPSSSAGQPSLPESHAPLARFPLAGRTAEVAVLLDAWTDAVRGCQRLALVSGEPGIGKTRLTEEIASRVQSQAAAVLFGPCEEVAQVPFAPFTLALRAFLRDDPPRDVVEALGSSARELARLAPGLGTALGEPAPLTADAEIDRHRLFDAIVRWLDIACERGPVLLVIENLHWASGQTLLLLRHLARAPGARRLLVLATYRDTDLHPAHPAREVLASLAGEPGALTVPLQALGPAAVETFLRTAGGDDLAAGAGELAHLVCRRSGGNPFLLGELLSGLRESGVIGGPPERLFEQARSGLSAGVRTLVRQRLRRLSSGGAHVLPLASVAGYEFGFAVVAEIAGMSEDRLLEALDEGVRVRLIEPTEPGAYRFFHHIVREVLYQNLGAAQRADLHLRVAQTLESLRGPYADAHLGAIAHHYERAAAAGGRAKAVEYAVRAAERAAASLAHGLAAEHYRHAVELLDGEAEPRRRIELLLPLGEAQRDAGDPEFRDTLLEAARLAQSMGDAESLVRAALANTRGFSMVGAVDAERVAVIEAALCDGAPSEGPARARLLALLGSELAFSADVERPRRLADEALVMARRLGDRRTLAEVLERRYLIAATPDTLEERLRYAAELDALGAELGDTLARYWALVMLTLASLEAGDGAAFERSLRLYEGVVDELGHPMMRWGLLRLQALRAMLAGDAARAEALLGEAFDLGRATVGRADAGLTNDYQLLGIRRLEGRLKEMEPVVRRLVAEHSGVPGLAAVAAAFYCEIGRAEDARPFVGEAVRTSFARIPWDVSWITTMTAYAFAAARLGEKAAAEVLYSRLSPFPRHVESNGGGVTGCVSHYLGLLAVALGRFEEAARHFAVARRVHARLGARYWIVATEIEHARMLLTRGAGGYERRGRQRLAAAARLARKHGFPALAHEAAKLERASTPRRRGASTKKGRAKAGRLVALRPAARPARQRT